MLTSHRDENLWLDGGDGREAERLNRLQSGQSGQRLKRRDGRQCREASGSIYDSRLRIQLPFGFETTLLADGQHWRLGLL